MKKKVLATLLALSLLISLFSGITAFAAAGSINATLTGPSSSVAPLGSVTVTIGADTFTNITGGIVGAQLKLNYDATKYDFVGIAISSQSSVNPVEDLTATASDGVVSILYFDNNGTAFTPLVSGAFFDVSFTVKEGVADGDTTFTLSGESGTASGDWVDTSENTISATYNPLTVTIATTITDPVASWGTYKTMTGFDITELGGGSFNYGTDVIYNVEPGTTVNNFFQNFVLANGITAVVTEMWGYTYSVAEYNDYCVGSGTVIALYSGETLLKSYTVLIFGDLDGDGYTATSSDWSMITDYATEVNDFSGYSPAALWAGDLFWEGATTSSGWSVITDIATEVGATIIQDPLQWWLVQ
jgi:hypothetical protein